ncbi:hypothetical protein EC957_006701 [Mortierella hygrophila]|uniref:WD40 repeat-like protein n=1 Tax=Mortierella hygrophila TaxID=979708 RepID=A0A9P6EZK0_9FUNG|nr:hypothetical protein EC957_006701 [Mortierella hygrophila]
MSASNAPGHQSSQQVDPAIEKLVREQKSLKAKIDVLEAENKALKKSLFELSYIYSAQLGSSNHQPNSNSSTNSASRPLNNSNNSGIYGDVSVSSTATSLPHTANNAFNASGSHHNEMVLAVGQLLSNMSAAQQSHGAEAVSSNPANSSDATSRGTDAKLKNATDLIKVEEDSVRRLNMGNIVSRQDGSSKSDGRQFFLKNDLKGHQGAVYAVQYSPNGKYLATGSFDKTVRIWDGTTNQNELYVLKGHGLNISDLAWGHDSALLLSGAYDKTCKLWDVESGKQLDSFEGEGFVQCVRFHPQDNHIFFSGTTRNMLTMIDTRKDSNPTSGSAIAIKNDTMVNSIYVYHDGLTVISGDSSGYLKTWDMRTGKVLQAILNEPTKKPISHLAISKQRGSLDGVSLAETEEPESRWLAVNSYDNVIRVYDRGFEPPTTIPRLVYSLKGYRNKHWPIKSAFFHGKDYIAGAAGRRTGKVRGGDGDEAASTISDKDIPLESSLILASGSMDPYVYLFDVGAGDGQYEVLQKLSGHTDRVYDVDFHPVDHVLASGSADFSVKVWGRASKRKK